MGEIDCRQLVPRTPPDGMGEWVLKGRAEELDRWGFVYQAEYVEDDGLPGVSAQRPGSRKTKMVRVTCSCCGASLLLNWGKAPAGGYGFILPEDEEGDWDHTVTAAGDQCRCPACNHSVLVNKRAAIKGDYITAETTCMSASLVGEGRLLALTGWTVQRLTSKDGVDSLKIIPAEAYVFSAEHCVQLMGWRNGYGGQCGYFIQYNQGWNQPKNWVDRWGRETDIFGLTPELVAASCLPHCKLDVYMGCFPDLVWRYPIVYLRLYQQHPNVEAILTHGLPLALCQMIQEKIMGRVEPPRTGLVELDGINWKETRPAQMLSLTRDELRIARDQAWGALFWRLFVQTKAAGETLTEEDIQNAFYLGDPHVLELIGWGQVRKSIRYLIGQMENVDPEDMVDVPTLIDYWSMSEQLSRDLSDPSVRFPVDLARAHNAMAELSKRRELDALDNSFRLRQKELKKYIFVADGLMIRPAASQRELTAEGDALHHCVSSYGSRHIAGQTAIFFIRRVSRPQEPYYTLELDEKELTVRQNRGLYNCARTPEIQAFEDRWLLWLRGGCQRGRDGKPIWPRERRGEVA